MVRKKEIKSYKILDENFPPSPPIKDAKLYILNEGTVIEGYDKSSTEEEQTAHGLKEKQH